MADNTTTTTTAPAASPAAVAPTEPAAAAAPKILTVIDDMQNRMLFDTVDDAGAYLAKCQTDFADFNSYPFAGVGIDEEGFDPEIYTADMRVAVAILTQRGEGSQPSTVKAIVVYPSPTIAAIMGTATGSDWLTGILEKEINHVAVRQLRKADDADAIADAIQTMPTTVEAYTTSGRESTGGILATFNDLWQLIKKGISAKSSPFRLANLSKKELRKSLESSAYAMAVYPKLEDRTNKRGEPESLFVIAATYGQLLAKGKGLDTTVFDRCLSQRDEKVIDVAADDDDDEFDFDAMVKATETKPAAIGDQAPAGDSAATDLASDAPDLPIG